MRYQRLTVTGPVSLPVLLVTLLAAGCGGPTLYPVTGEVLIQPERKPLAAVIEFRPVNGPQEQIARATSDTSGRFELETPRQGMGAVPGEYLVVLVPLTPDDFDGVPLAEQVRVLEPIDRKYRDYDTTPLRFTVTTDAVQNHFHIDVEAPKNRGRARR